MIALGYSLALLIGLALGLLGGGGSILTVPVLHYVMGFPLKEAAVPMSLVVVGVSSGVGALTHWKSGSVNLRAALAFAPPAIVGAVLGAELALRVDQGIQLIVFGVVLLLAAFSMFFGTQRLVDAAHVGDRARRPIPLITLVGGLVGMLTGFVGVGGGFIYVPTLVLFAGLPMKEAVGTSLVLIMTSCLAGAVRYHGSYTLDWKTIAIFTAIAMVGVAIGSRVVHHISQLKLRRGFALFLVLMGFFVLLSKR